MKRVFFGASLFLLMVGTAGAGDLVDQVVGEKVKAIPMEAIRPEEMAKYLSSAKVVGKVDIDGKTGTTTSVDLEVLFTKLPLKEGEKEKTFFERFDTFAGVIGGIKDDNVGTAWKVGPKAQIYTPQPFPKMFPSITPYLNLALTWNEPAERTAGALTGAYGAGLSFLLGDKPCKRSALEIDVTQQRATRDIFFKDETAKSYDTAVNLGLKVFFN